MSDINEQYELSNVSAGPKPSSEETADLPTLGCAGSTAPSKQQVAPPEEAYSLSEQPAEQTPEPIVAETAPVYEEAVPTQETADTQKLSYFDGRTIQLIGWRLLGVLLTAVTFGIGAPWAECMIYRWQAKHTIVEGRRLCFDGKGHQLLGRYLLWAFLTLITAGIFVFFLPVRIRKWHSKHLNFATGRVPAPKTGQTVVLIACVVIGALLAGLAATMLPGLLGRWQESLATPTTPPTTLPITQNTTLPSTQPTTEVTTPANVWYVNSKTGLYVRDSADADYETIDHLEYGTKVEVEYWEGKLGFIGYGWCNGDYLTQEKPTDAPEEGKNEQTAPESSVPDSVLDPSIVGQWYNVVLDPRNQDGIYFALESRWDFRSDGTYYRSFVYISLHYNPATGEVALLDPGYTDLLSKGTYTYDGSTLVVTSTYDNETGDHAPETMVYNDVTVSGDTLYFGIQWERGTYAEIAQRTFGQSEEG